MLLGAVRGGGRLYAQPPLEGYTEEEMCAEAKLRIEHNKQRRRLKQLMAAASDDGSTVATKDLLLAAKLAKMELPEEFIADTPFATKQDRVGLPTSIAYKPFYANIPAPALRGPGGFGDLPPLRKNQSFKGSMTEVAATTITATPTGNLAKDEDVEYWFKVMQEKMQTRFSELRRAFRTLDKDASGELSAEEFKEVLVMFNLGVPDKVMDKLIDLADFDGDGSINYAEFARIFTTESVLNMKKTLSATGDDAQVKSNYVAQQGGKGKIDKETGDNVRLRRTGPSLDKIRRAHTTLRNAILARYGNMKECFAEIDADGSGFVRRKELKTFLNRLTKSIPDQVISGLISYVDTDGDAKTLSQEEFLKMMKETFVDDVVAQFPQYRDFVPSSFAQWGDASKKK